MKKCGEIWTMKHAGTKPVSIKGSKFEAVQGYSKVISLKIDNKKHTPLLSFLVNTFGIDWKDKTRKKVFCRIEDKKGYIYFHSKTSDFQPLTPWICGASTVRLGKGIWGPSSGFELGKAGDYRKMKTSVKWDFNAIKGYSDLSYDIWLTKKKESTNSEKKDVEIMVVLSSNFKFPWKKIGENDNFIILHNDKNKFEHFKDKGHTITFILKKKTNRAKFDISDLIKYPSKYLKLNLKDYYLRSIDIIQEFTKNAESEVKLYNLDFDFIRKRG